MITRFWAESAMAVVTMIFGLGIVYGALDFGVGWDSSGPQPGAFPFYTGLLVAAASLGTLVLTLSKRFTGSGNLQDVFLDREQGKRVAAFFLPMLAFAVLSVTLGMYVATILYLVRRRLPWWTGRYFRGGARSRGCPPRGSSAAGCSGGR